MKLGLHYKEHGMVFLRPSLAVRKITVYRSRVQVQQFPQVFQIRLDTHSDLL
ncbi:hypothetical protein ACFL45_07365 [Candidatus Neomarinimicrobiota bacterium]